MIDVRRGGETRCKCGEKNDLIPVYKRDGKHLMGWVCRRCQKRKTKR